MKWIFLSPHLDDAILSCGGIMWQLKQQGDTVLAWTIFSGDPPDSGLTPVAEDLHRRWGTGLNATRIRRAEDRSACERLGIQYQHEDWLDCIYRILPGTGLPTIGKLEELSRPVPPEEAYLTREISREIEEMLSSGCRLVSPLAIGGHIDHRHVRAAVDMLDGQPQYYADFPYAARGERLEALGGESAWHKEQFTLSKEALAAWQDAVACYVSQISTFWQSESAMRAAVKDFASRGGGSFLLRRV